MEKGLAHAVPGFIRLQVLGAHLSQCPIKGFRNRMVYFGFIGNATFNSSCPDS